MMCGKQCLRFFSRCFWKEATATLIRLVLLLGFVVQHPRAETLDKSWNAATDAKAYERALKLDPHQEAVRQKLVEIFIAQKVPEAIQTLQVGVSAAPKDFVRVLSDIDKGLESNPASIHLLLLKADVLVQLDREPESRQVLEEAFRLSPNDPKVAARLATMRDIHGDRAGEAYQALASALASDNTAQPAVIKALERGLVVSLRDGEHDRAVQIANRLRELGARDVADLNHSKLLAFKRSTVAVPGG